MAARRTHIDLTACGDAPTVWIYGILHTLVAYLGSDKWEAADEDGLLVVVSSEHFGRDEGTGTILYPEGKS